MALSLRSAEARYGNGSIFDASLSHKKPCGNLWPMAMGSGGAGNYFGSGVDRGMASLAPDVVRENIATDAHFAAIDYECRRKRSLCVSNLPGRKISCIFR